MKTGFFAILSILILLCVQSWGDEVVVQPEQRASDHSLRFIVFGGTRPHKQGQPPPQIFEDTIGEVNLLCPDLVVHTGDQIFGRWEESEDQNEEWDRFDALWETIECPKKYRVVGDHDIYSLQDEQIYRERYGSDSLYYSVSAYGCHFIVLNTEDRFGGNSEGPGWIQGPQFEWLKSDLERWGHRRTFVFLHRPLWKEGENPEHWQDDILPLLKEYNVDCVFAGHWQAFDYSVQEDIPCVITGAAGTLPNHDHEYDQGAFHHVVFVTVPADREQRSEVTAIRTGNILNPYRAYWIRRDGNWIDTPGERHKVTSTREHP